MPIDLSRYPEPMRDLIRDQERREATLPGPTGRSVESLYQRFEGKLVVQEVDLPNPDGEGSDEERRARDTYNRIKEACDGTFGAGGVGGRWVSTIDTDVAEAVRLSFFFERESDAVMFRTSGMHQIRA